jgi:drug/metabolite transporter (DMT)-like permease
MQALFNIYLYRNNVKGRIYKDAFNNLGNGFTSVIVVLVVLRCFESLSSHLTKLSLGPILLIVYLLLIALSIGYILIFRGARSLHRIEEI